MILGSVQMVWNDPDGYWNPDRFTAPESGRLCAVQDSETNTVHFDFGMVIVGKVIDLEWEWMPYSLFAEIDALYVAGADVIWNVEEAGIPAFMVGIISVEGALFDDGAYDIPFRKDVRVRLMIMSEVAAS